MLIAQLLPSVQYTVTPVMMLSCCTGYTVSLVMNAQLLHSVHCKLCDECSLLSCCKVYTVSPEMNAQLLHRVHCKPCDECSSAAQCAL